MFLCLLSSYFRRRPLSAQLWEAAPSHHQPNVSRGCRCSRQFSESTQFDSIMESDSITRYIAGDKYSFGCQRCTVVVRVSSMYSNQTNRSYHFIFWIGPCIGSLFASFLYRLVFADRERRLSSCTSANGLEWKNLMKCEILPIFSSYFMMFFVNWLPLKTFFESNFTC